MQPQELVKPSSDLEYARATGGAWAMLRSPDCPLASDRLQLAKRNFVFLQALWWRGARRTPWSLFLISLSVVVGMWLERYMILVTSLYRDFLISSWGSYTPTFWDWATYFGTIGLFMVPFLLVIRVFPVISIFETKEILHEEQAEPSHA